MKKYLIIRADGSETEVIQDSLATSQQLQEWVGGYAEPVHVKYEGKTKRAYIDEEGRLKSEQRYNATATQLFRDYHGLQAVSIVGDMVVLLGA